MEINKQRNQYFTPFCWSGKGFSSSLNDIQQIILRYFGNPDSSDYCCVTVVRASDSEKGRVPCCTTALPPKVTSYLLMYSAVRCNTHSVPYSTVLYSTVQYSAVQCNTPSV